MDNKEKELQSGEKDLDAIIDLFDNELKKPIHNCFLDTDENQILNSKMYEREKCGLAV